MADTPRAPSSVPDPAPVADPACILIAPLTPDQIDDAYVLARLGYRDLTLEDWRQKAALALASEVMDCQIQNVIQGMIAACNPAGRLRGLLLYTIAARIAAGPVLNIERLIAFGVLDPAPIAEALTRHVLDIAKDAGCDGFSLTAPLGSHADTMAWLQDSTTCVLHRVF